MRNPFLNLISQADAPAVIIGVVIADGKFAAKVRFGAGTNMTTVVPWIKEKFCRWATCHASQVECSESELTVEMKVK